MRGQKTGGRQAGTPNKATLSVQQKLEALGCDPIEGMARLAMDEGQPAALRAAMFKELATYVAPRRAPTHACLPPPFPPSAFRGDPKAIDAMLADMDDEMAGL